MKKSKAGKWLIGLGAALALLSRQKLSMHVKGIYLNGLITKSVIPLRIIVSLTNKTMAKVFIRSLSGSLISHGAVVATVNQVVNKRIRANSVVEQNILVDIHKQEALQSLFENIESGHVNNISFELIGELQVGEQYPIGIQFSRIFTWQDIKTMI